MDTDRVVECLDALDRPARAEPGDRGLHVRPGPCQLLVGADPFARPCGLGRGGLRELPEFLSARQRGLVQDGCIQLLRGLVPGCRGLADGIVGGRERGLETREALQRVRREGPRLPQGVPVRMGCA